MNQASYALRLAILYGAIWFIDLLDASLITLGMATNLNFRFYVTYSQGFFYFFSRFFA